jgi:Rieske Fe-S protein
MEYTKSSGCGAGTLPCASRRAVLAVAGAAGVGVLGGCQVYGASAEDGAPAADPTNAGAAAPAASGSGGATGGVTGAGGGPALAKTGDIPVGGGKVFQSRGVVVTQPQAGTFKAFSATCTHQGCAVSEVKGGTINCACHGSKFKIADGSVAGGPAPKALPTRTVTVDGDSIRLG